MPKKVKVNQDTCIGCGSCTATCPNTFAMNDQGKSQVQNPQGESEEQIQSAIDACPVKAISWEEEGGEQQ